MDVLGHIDISRVRKMEIMMHNQHVRRCVDGEMHEWDAAHRYARLLDEIVVLLVRDRVQAP